MYLMGIATTVDQAILQGKENEQNRAFAQALTKQGILYIRSLDTGHDTRQEVLVHALVMTI